MTSKLPLLLLVDDSEAVLDFERAVLAPHYQLACAQDGEAALHQARAVRPAAILLDLTMPKMGGLEVLKVMATEPALSEIPVVVVSSEAHRLEECIAAGAVDFLSKPIRAEALLRSVAQALQQVQAQARRGSHLLLPLRVGQLRLGIPLEGVQMVALHPRLQPLPGVPDYVTGYFMLQGDPVAVLDLSLRLGRSPQEGTAIDRWVVILWCAAAALALAVDEVDVPVEVLEERFSGAEEVVPLLQPSRLPLCGVAQLEGRSLPVVKPEAFFKRSLLRKLPQLLPQGVGAVRGS